MAENNSVPRVKEVAVRSGVSEATVSRVLNGNYKHGFSVRDEVRQRITEAADALGYRPNLAAKNLVKRQTKMVAILGSNIVIGWPGNIYQEIVNTLVKTLRVRGYDVCITVPSLEKDETELPNWKVDGVIVLQECSARTIEQMEKTNLSYVVINGVGGSKCSSVIPDDIEATRRAISYLADIGHRRIAYAGPTSSHKKHRSIDDRHNTYLSVLAEYNFEPIPGHDTVFRSAPAFLTSAVLENHATAILAYDHVEALKILHGAHVLNIQIPKQVSLMCFNDEYLCSIVTPSLTSIGMSLKQIGRIAAEKLLRHIESPRDNHPECIKLSQDLIIRDSTSPPPKQ
ncbi:MAG: LacI family DNA-binding transcriptional regulator [Sedimentisphaerales bacterium]